jgi:hypothetical protein
MTLFTILKFIQLSAMRLRITVAVAVQWCVQFILFSTVSSYSLKIPSDSIEFSAERTMEGDVEIYRSFSASLTHQSAVENVQEPENTDTSKSYSSDQRRMDDKPTDLNINKAPPRGRVPPLPRPFPNPDAYNDRRIPTKKSTSVDTLSENRLDFKASLHAGGPTATSEFKKHESKSGAEQTQTDNFQKPEPLTPNQKFYGGLVISVRNLQSYIEANLLPGTTFAHTQA